MPKHKTHKGLAKRFRVTASGKLKHRRAGGRKLLSHKSAKRKRRLHTRGILAAVETPKLIRIMERT